ncbi:PspC domain-containing protein [Alkalibacter mobilis]|uniref:PspC domain-containing protein n=1 Tax=Alkalibacter mobilis TaxID=2787712 RepID=UPI00189E685D|nr:PspC domain-containing protein [Alkalibacter mobilis]MBF7096549.1 PspC domain-containing protein [Alkalibacter mobilis]
MNKRLFKSRKDKMVLGVCGGVAKYFGIDASVVRIIWAVTALVYGTGVLLYLIAAFILPYEDELYGRSNESVEDNDQDQRSDTENQRKVLGAVLIISGLFLLLKNFRFFFNTDMLWPVIIIGFGLFLIIKGRNDNQ